MSIFDAIKQKAEELMGNPVEDVTNNLGDIGGQIQDVLPGQDGEEEQK